MVSLSGMWDENRILHSSAGFLSAIKCGQMEVDCKMSWCATHAKCQESVAMTHLNNHPWYSSGWKLLDNQDDIVIHMKTNLELLNCFVLCGVHNVAGSLTPIIVQIYKY